MLTARVQTSTNARSREPHDRRRQRYLAMDACIKKTLKNLFTPFFTTKKRGTGLGMVVSLKIIERHNGKIKVISRKSVGTKVQVFLPIKKK